MADIQEIYTRLLASRYQERLFSDLLEPEQEGRYDVRAFCPFCEPGGGTGRGHLTYSLSKPLWRCFQCGKQGDWLKYLQLSRRIEFVEALQLLAQAAGVDLELSDNYRAKHQAYTRKADLLEAAQDILSRSLLQDQAAEPVRAYLEARGYTEEDISLMSLGAYSASLQQQLQAAGYSEQELRDAGLLAQAWQSHPLTLLYRDPAGRAIGLAGRSILSREEIKAAGQAPYYYSAKLRKSAGLVGLESVRGEPQLLLVEGLLDALYLNSLDVKTVALGGTDLSTEQIQALQANGTKELLLALDMDEAGQAGTEKAIQLLRDADLRAYVVSLPRPYKDADELVRAEGKWKLEDILLQAEAWPKWLARRLIQKHDLQTDIGRDRALEAALSAYVGIEDKLEARAFSETLRASLSLSEEELLQRASEYSQKASQKASQSFLEASVKHLQALISEQDILGAEIALQESLSGLRQSRGVVAPEPYLMEDLAGDILTLGSGLSTGWSALDNLAKIPQGAITLITARPGQGKTTLQLNLLAHLLKAYPAKAFYFFSYEEARPWLAIKLIMGLSGKVLNPAFNLEAYLDYMRDKRASQPVKEIEKAIQLYEDWTGSGRLIISDKRLAAEDLATTIGYLAQRAEVGAVLIDYIQKIGLRRPESRRYVEIKRVSDLLLDQAVRTGLPIILGAQLGRATGKTSAVTLDNLRESGDLEQDANLVLGLYNEAVEKAEEETPIAKASGKPDQVDLKITVLKQRGGRPGRSCLLNYNMPAYQITDRSGSSLI